MEASQIPEWLTVDFLKTCLESDKENFPSIVIKRHIVENAVAAGNNYKSEMLRVKVQYKKQEEADNEYSLSILVKAPKTTGVMESFKEVASVLYEREPKYYNEFIKETYNICKHDIVPRPYACPIPQCVVMEDLGALGYIMVDRKKLLDFDHCQLYIQASSKLHALSIVVNKKNPELIQSLVSETPGMTKGMFVIFKALMARGLQCMAAYLEDKPDYKEYMNVINQLLANDNLLKIFLEMMKTERPLKALIQEDPWSANMMFKYDKSNSVLGVKLFDFQRLKFTSPVMEFVCFVWGAINPEVRETKLNYLYHSYCDSLNKNLTNLGCPERLSFDTMKQEVATFSPMVMFYICSMLPIYITDGVADVHDYLTGDVSDVPVKESTFYKLYKSTHFNKYYPKVLDQVIKEGVLDYLAEKIKSLTN